VAQFSDYVTSEDIDDVRKIARGAGAVIRRSSKKWRCIGTPTTCYMSTLPCVLTWVVLSSGTLRNERGIVRAMGLASSHLEKLSTVLQLVV
jgi:hypothetical protein